MFAMAFCGSIPLPPQSPVTIDLSQEVTRSKAKEEVTEQLIELVRSFSYLYDQSHFMFKNLAKKTEAWNLIAEELGITSDEAKAKWRNLRNIYIKQKREDSIGQTKKNRKEWFWREQMKFLDNFIRRRRRPNHSNISNQVIEDSIFLVSDASQQSEQHESQITSMSPSLPEKNKHDDFTSTIATLDKLLEYLERENPTRDLDLTDHLFLSYANTFKKFQPSTQALLKMELATLFGKTEMRELGSFHSHGAVPSASRTSMQYDQQSPFPAGLYKSLSSVRHENALQYKDNFGAHFLSG